MDENKEFYWSIAIEPGWAQAAIWTIENKKTRVISLSKPARWESEEDLVNTVDSVLSAAVQEFPEEEKEPSKTVFGVPPSWVAEGQIKSEHLKNIREICKKLSLKPSGFVVLPEALAHGLKLEEGAPLSGVLVGVTGNSLDITVFRLGNMVGTVSVGRSVSVVEDVIEGLARFNSLDNVPSRFLLYDGSDAELNDIKDSLVDADWTGELKEKVKILHAPQVEIVDVTTKINAVSLAGASEIGEVDGFYKENQEMVEETPSMAREELSQVSLEEGQESAESLGFAIDQDVTNKDVEPSIEKIESHQTSFKGTPKQGLESIKALPAMLIHKVKSLIPKRSGTRKMPKPMSPPKFATGTKKRLAIIIGVVILITVVGLGVAYYALPKAEIVIYVSPRTLSQSETLTLNENATSYNPDSQVLPAKMVEVTVSSSKTKSATGSKTVGEKATGTIEIRNGTSSGVQLKSGTVLTGPNDLKFILDQAASVSAAVSPSEPGSVTVNVTADDIGSQYNLAKDETLSVSNYPTSEVDAKVDSDMSGGSSRETVVVSAADLTSLEDDLIEELKDQGRVQLEDKISSDEVLLDDVLNSKVASKNYSNDVGEEAETVKLELELTVSGLVVAKSDLDAAVLKVLEGEIPDGFVLRTEQVDIELSLEEEIEGGEWVFDAQMEANLLPDIMPENIAKDVSGKSQERAKEYIKSVPGYERAEIKLKPGLPGPLNRLPFQSSHISIEIVASR